MGNARNLTVFTFAHWAVDFACFFLLYAVFAPRAGADGTWAGFLAYNAIAFGLQPFIGWLCDARRQARRPAAFGALLIACSFALFSLPWAALAAAALGNALFHAGGGADTLARSGGKAAPGGVFVASGALGVSLGAFAGKGALLPLWAPPVLLCACALLILLLCRDAEGTPVPAAGGRPRAPSFGAVVSLCLTTVLLRAFIGVTLPAPWTSVGAFVFLGSVCALAGKAAGGFLGDALGMRRAGTASLALSAALLAFAGKTAPGFAAALILFNVSMPLTLAALYGQLPDRPGFAFGLTTLALLAGALPSFFFALPAGAALWGGAALALVSALCLYPALTNKTGGVIRHDSVSSRSSSV